MTGNQVSVEYAHIYTNQKIDEEHEQSLSILHVLKSELAGKELSLVVMVDDYSFPDPTFDYEKFLDWLTHNGFKPDLAARESQLIPVCDEVVSLIKDNKLKKQIVEYIRANKYPCSLFIAAWYLLRLGKLSSAMFPQHLVSESLLNILPESFRPFEDKGLEIIRATKFADAVTEIDYRFFEGRLIA